MNVGEDPTTDTLLNQLNTSWYSKYLSSYPQVSYSSPSHQGQFSLKQTETISEKTTNQNVELWSPVPTDTSIVQLSHLINAQRSL